MLVTWVLCLVLLIFQYYISPYKFRDMRVIFDAWWLVVITLFVVSKSQYYPTTGLVWNHIFVGILAVNMADFFFRLAGTKIKKVKLRTNYVKPVQIGMDSVVNSYYKVIICIQLILLLAMIPLFLRALPTIMIGGLGSMRSLYVGATTETFMSTFERILYIHFGVFPGVCACALLAAVLWANGQMKLRYLSITALNIACVTLITGARTYIFYFFIFVVGAFAKDGKKILLVSHKKYNRVKRNVILLVVVILVVLIAITSQRSFGGNRSSRENLFTTVSVYFSGGIKLFDVVLNNPEQFGLNYPMFGIAIISGLLSVIQLLLSYVPVIGSFFYGELITNLVQQNVTSYIMVGPQLTMNAAPTMFYYFMRDFGVFGLLSGGMVVALLMNMATKQLRYNSFKASILYLEVLLIVILGVCWWEPYRMEFWVIPVQVFFWLWLAKKVCVWRKKL
ncbi:MAG: O-antigen polymerase [Evtepia sp.]